MSPPILDGGPAPETRAGSLPRLLRSLFAAEGQRSLLHEEATGWHSAAELDELSAEAARLYAGAGLVAGDRLVLSAGSSLSFVVAHLAALRLGLVLVPANTAYTARELAHIAEDCHPAGVVSDDPARHRVLAAASDRPLAHFRIEGGRLDGPAAAAPVELDWQEGPEPALIVYTSGTTGQPKGALLTHHNLLANAAAVIEAWRLSPEDRLVCSLPLFHVHGLCVALQANLAAGASILLRRHFDPADVGAAIAEHSASLFFGVPTMYARLLGTTELSRLRLAVSGSAPLPAALHRQLAAAHRQEVLERYGMSETLMIATNPYEGERRASTVGGPFPGVTLRLDEPGGEAGEVLVKGPGVFSGYFGRPAETAAAFDADGWFHTGDLGTLDDDGYLRLVGRKSELIITGGYNVYPREVEEVLRRFPGVRDAAVVGEPDDLWGERVVAFVESDEAALDKAALVSFAAGELAGYKLPRRLELLSALPRNSLGKVLKAELSSPGG